MATKLELVQTVLDPVTGAVLHEPGELFSPNDKIVALVGQTGFREVQVDDPKPKPPEKPAPKKTP